jgi:hypothetical protein
MEQPIAHVLEEDPNQRSQELAVIRLRRRGEAAELDEAVVTE